MRFIILITVAISVFAFASQSASALPVQDSHRVSSGLSKRKPNGLVSRAGYGFAYDEFGNLGDIGSILDSFEGSGDGDLVDVGDIFGSDNTGTPNSALLADGDISSSSSG